MKEEELNKALDNRRRAEGKRKISSELLSLVNTLKAVTPSSIGGWREFDRALCRLNEFAPDIRRPILDKLSEVLCIGFIEISAQLNREASELDREFDAM